VFETRARGRINISHSKAVATGVAGMGGIFSHQTSRREGEREKMTDADRTFFNDEIAILGQPVDWIPIGFATFFCEVTGEFAQPFSGASVSGTADAEASFQAKSKTDQQQWNFPSLGAGIATPIYHVLKVTIAFVIGEPFSISATLHAHAQERGRRAVRGDLAATLQLKTELLPIQVVRVNNPHVETVSAHQPRTKYYASSEAGATNVSLRSTELWLEHR